MTASIVVGLYRLQCSEGTPFRHASDSHISRFFYLTKEWLWAGTLTGKDILNKLLLCEKVYSDRVICFIGYLYIRIIFLPWNHIVLLQGLYFDVLKLVPLDIKFAVQTINLEFLALVLSRSFVAVSRLLFFPGASVLGHVMTGYVILVALGFIWFALVGQLCSFVYRY